jgi:hypothetical protein
VRGWACTASWSGCRRDPLPWACGWPIGPASAACSSRARDRHSPGSPLVPAPAPPLTVARRGARRAGRAARARPGPARDQSSPDRDGGGGGGDLPASWRWTHASGGLAGPRCSSRRPPPRSRAGAPGGARPDRTRPSAGPGGARRGAGLLGLC